MGMTDDELDVLGGGFKEMGGSGVGCKVDLLAEMEKERYSVNWQKVSKYWWWFWKLVATTDL